MANRCCIIYDDTAAVQALAKSGLKLSCIAFLYIAVWFFTFVPQCAVRAAADFLVTLRESREVRDN